MLAEEASEYCPAGETDTYIVRLAGDMDIHHADDVRSTLLTAIARAPRRADVVIDLRNSSFCDSSGLNVLLLARRRAQESGHSIRLAAPSHQMLRLLELTGSVGLFPVGPTVRD